MNFTAARLPVSRRASTCALTLVSFRKEGSVTKRRLESVGVKDGDGGNAYINSRLVSFQSCYFSNGFLPGAAFDVGRVLAFSPLSGRLVLGILLLVPVSFTSNACAAEPVMKEVLP